MLTSHDITFGLYNSLIGDRNTRNGNKTKRNCFAAILGKKQTSFFFFFCTIALFLKSN